MTTGEKSEHESFQNDYPKHNPRVLGLDIFRVLLTIEILMFHSNGHIGCSYGKYIDLFLRAGAVTMTAFFILSGYVNEFGFETTPFVKERRS